MNLGAPASDRFDRLPRGLAGGAGAPDEREMTGAALNQPFGCGKAKSAEPASDEVGAVGVDFERAMLLFGADDYAS